MYFFVSKLAPLQKLISQLDTHFYYHTSTMDDNANKKKARKVDSSNDVDFDPQQEGEIPYPFTIEDKRVKNGSYCLAYAALLKASFVKPCFVHQIYCFITNGQSKTFFDSYILYLITKIYGQLLQNNLDAYTLY
jgi:hypothetical protein